MVESFVMRRWWNNRRRGGFNRGVCVHTYTGDKRKISRKTERGIL
jgi:hypothetical protein